MNGKAVAAPCRATGIATVFHNLATSPLMSIARNFFLGREPAKSWGPWRRLRWTKMNDIAAREIASVGIHVRSALQAVSTLSGSEGLRIVAKARRAVWASSSSPTTSLTLIPCRCLQCAERGRSLGPFRKSEVTRDQVIELMAGGRAMAKLESELSGLIPTAA